MLFFWDVTVSLSIISNRIVISERLLCREWNVVLKWLENFKYAKKYTLWLSALSAEMRFSVSEWISVIIWHQLRGPRIDLAEFYFLWLSVRNISLLYAYCSCIKKTLRQEYALRLRMLYRCFLLFYIHFLQSVIIKIIIKYPDHSCWM